MHISLKHGHGLIIAILLLSGCSSHLMTKGSGFDAHTYLQAIADAAVIEPNEVVPLPVIDDDRVQVVTWTRYPGSYHAGEEVTLSWGDVWVTLDQAVKDECQTFDQSSLTLGVQQLLGLPGDNSEQRSFVTLSVAATALFRPCANPSLTADRCEMDFNGDVSPEHAAWYARQVAQSYQTQSGFPWTRLGYTYNWKVGANEVGPAEFVIQQGALAKTISVVETQAYCQSSIKSQTPQVNK